MQRVGIEEHPTKRSREKIAIWQAGRRQVGIQAGIYRKKEIDMGIRKFM
jgi:hypothetical protein